MVRMRVLGPIEADVNGTRVELGGPRQRAVLALLLSVRGGVLSVDRMIEQLWQGEPPPRAIASLQSYVSNLRRLLEPDRPPRAPAGVLISSPPGYALRLPEDAVDAWRFEAVLRQARTVPADRARVLLDEALGWWRGTAYCEVADEEWAVTEIARLTELRLTAREFLIRSTIDAGRWAEAVAPAEVFTREHPLREEGWRLLALALWGSGRQADALGALRRSRRILHDELGLDPGPALTELERAILGQRMEVLHPEAPRPAGEARGATLPAGGHSDAGLPTGVSDRRRSTGVSVAAGTPAAGNPADGPAAGGSPMSGGSSSVEHPTDEDRTEGALSAVPELRPRPPYSEPRAGVAVTAVGQGTCNDPAHAVQKAARAAGADPAQAGRTPAREARADAVAVARVVVATEGDVVGHDARDAHHAVLGDLAPSAPEVAQIAQVAVPAHPVAVAPDPAATRTGAPGGSGGSAPADVFVGREDELRALDRAAEAARHTGGTVLITGEAGAGKSRLLGCSVRRLAADGWTVVVGRCPEFDGAPPAWAWVEALRLLAQRFPPADPDAVAPLLRESLPPSARSDTTSPSAAGDVAAGRFLLHRAVGTWMSEAAATAPLAVVVDDLHRADAETLALLEHLTGPDGPPVLVLTAHRATETGDRLAATLAEIAPRSPHRLALGGLSPSDVRTLVTAVCGAPVDPDTLAALAERTGGNPFYVRESALLLASEGSLVAVSEVPQGVRDVLRRRLARLPDHAVAVLLLTAVVGREAEVDVLVHASDLPEHDVLDGLEAGVVAGLLTEPAPGRVRFTHALVRDTLYTDLTRLRRSRAHARIAEALRDLRPGDPTALAHHCSQSGTATLAPLAVDYGLRAAELAERRYAHDVAADLLERAVESYERIPQPGGDRDARLVDLLGQLLRAQIRAGATPEARRTRQRAIDIAERAGRDDLLATALSGWQVPTPWQTRPYGAVDHTLVNALERLLAHPDQDPATRCLLLDTLVAELAGESAAARVVLAARELLDLARTTGDPALLALALTSSAKCRSYERAVGLRARIAVELRELARTADLPVYRWVTEFIDGSVAGARNEPETLRRHAEAGLDLARRYRMVEPETVHLASLAMLAHIQGDFEVAAARYDEVGVLMRRHGMMHAREFHELSVIGVQLSRQRDAELEPLVRERYERLGPITGDTFALILARLGRLDEARAVRQVPLRHDHHHARHATIRAELALLLGRRDEAPDLLRQLLPLRDQLSGAAYTVFAMQPVAHSLGQLYRLLGDETAAVRYFARAEAVARRWASPHWAAAARSAAGES